MTDDASLLAGRRILVTGASGLVGGAMARSLAARNHVYGLARLTEPGRADLLSAAGIEPIACDLTSGDLSTVPDDVEIVLHFAAAKRARSSDAAMAANAEATGALMDRCRDAEAFLHCSTVAVYRPPAGAQPFQEHSPLGDHHRLQLPTYSTSKIAAEGVARTLARTLPLPTVIARLSCPYGDTWGWPLHHLDQVRSGEAIRVRPDDPGYLTPVHEHDMARQLRPLIEAATVPARIVNWCGDEQVTVAEGVRHMAGLLGLRADFAEDDGAFYGAPVDPTLRHAITGPTTVGWREGYERMVRCIAAS